MHIRKATTQDIYDIVKLNAGLFYEDGGQLDIGVNTSWSTQEGEEYFTTYLGNEKSVVFVAENEKKEVIAYLAGFVKPIASWRPVTLAELDSMYVREDYRAQKIGTLLVEEFKKWLTTFEVTRIAVTAFSQNKRALHFYRTLGFDSLSETLEMRV